jgi:hypothetical protein
MMIQTAGNSELTVENFNFLTPMRGNSTDSGPLKSKQMVSYSALANQMNPAQTDAK